ncbi:MAG: putative quinol monooxygenase [Eubacteriaceae bacterium]|nr:putative quinol monooxygenase [Eubacteriaceae bacterium]
MKILIVTYSCKTGMREEFLKAIQKEGIDKASRSESGNIRYSYFRPVEEGDTLLLLETWKDEDAFEKHCASPHFKRLGELKEKYVSDTVLEKFNK